MTLEVAEIMLLAGLIGASALILLVLLPWLVIHRVGFTGCLQCGSELNNGAGKCLMCGHSLQQRSLFEVLVQRLTESEEPDAPQTVTVTQHHLWAKQANERARSS